jgi:uncharacterized ferritin-like protein (DUF455 family)
VSADLFDRAEVVLASTSIADKVLGAQQLWAAWQRGEVTIERRSTDALRAAPPLLERPGCPGEPVLVQPRDLPRRKTGTPGGRAALLHAIAHIEFNAIHLALDACYRFRDLPDEYYGDWLSVAAEEAIHFALLEQALIGRGYRYGAFPAHDGLWEMAAKTRHDVLARMALVPRTLEARGLDATPEIRVRFAALQDGEATAILDRILADEIGHVAIGNRWYRWLCRERRLDPETTAAELAARFDAPRPQLPLNRADRLRGGFTESELDALERTAQRPARQDG